MESASEAKPKLAGANDDELAVYKPGCGAELETSEKQFAHVSYMY